MQNFDDLDIEGRNPSHLSEEEREKEEHDRKRLMRCSVTAEDGTLRPVYSMTDDDDIWCHICNISLFGAHKLLSHNSGNRHKIQLYECPYPVSLWSNNRTDGNTTKSKNRKSPEIGTGQFGDSLAPGEPVPPGMEGQLTRSTAIQVSLDRHRTSPLVGLEYLLELIDSESCEPSYTCVLCDKRGDPRIVMSHLTSYNHRITYLNRHFPTVSRAITDLPRTANYKRGANEISVLVAKKIEERFGRLQPQLVDKNQFEKNKMQYIKRIYQDYHFRETPELTFMEVYDVRWVTHFDEKMAEITGNTKKEALVAPQSRHGKHQYSFDEESVDEIPKKEEKKMEKERHAKKTDAKVEKEKTGMKIKILTKDKLNSLRKSEKSEKSEKPEKSEKSEKPEKSEEKSKSGSTVRPSDDTKSLSSLSSISSSPSRSRSRSRSPRRRPSAPLVSSRSRYHRSRSRSPQPLRERDKWDKYREQIRRAEETLERSLKFHEKNPEKHPSYPDEWKKFWNRRYKELQSEGKDPSKHDFKPEWIEFWNKRMREMHNEQLSQRKEEIRKRLALPEERERSPIPKRNRHRVDSDDDVEYVGTTKTVKIEYHDRHEPLRERDYGYTYTRGRAGIYRTSRYVDYPPRVVPIPRPRHYTPAYIKEKSPIPPAKEEALRDNLEIVGLLRLLTALEAQLGSLGPKVVSLLSRALAAEKAKPNSAEELLHDEEVSVLFETVKEKLKGQLFAGMIEEVAIAATKSAITNIAQLVHKASESKKKLEQQLAQLKQEEEERKRKLEMEFTRPLIASFASASRSIFQRPEIKLVKSEPVSVPGVGAVDKVTIAQQIAAALVAQGRTNVSQDELETLISAVVGMAEASQHSDKPITAASFVKGLTASAQMALTPALVAPTIALVTGEASKPPQLSPPAPSESSEPGFPPPVITPSSPTKRDTSREKSREARDLPEPSKSTRMESLSDSDLKTLLQNFKELGTDEQHGLINFLKKLEATDPPRVEKLRGYVNLGTASSQTESRKTVTPESERPPSRLQSTKGGRSTSPFSTRKGNHNPPDDDSKWKPKLDMFADDEAELKKQAQAQEINKRPKAKIDLSDDDDDYSFEDIYKAADKNVVESEKARRKVDSNSSRSWSRSRSRSVERVSQGDKSRDVAEIVVKPEGDPNAILNETKRLIANIMGDLPNKYVVKSHAVPQQQQPEVSLEVSKPVSTIPLLPIAQQNLYSANYAPNVAMQPQQAIPVTNPSMSYQQMGNQYQGYPQQQSYANSGYMNNGYNYNQSYGTNMMGNNQGQYGAAMSVNQYGQSNQQQNSQQQQSSYAIPPQYGPPSANTPIGYPQQQYGNYSQQRFY